jgi:hypothetical protein
MKSNIRFGLLIVLMVIGITLLIWANHIIRSYDGFIEVFKAARNAALPQSISGIIVLCVAYVLTYVKSK